MKTPLGTEVNLCAGHIVLDGFPALRERGTAPPPLLGPCLLWPRSPISATAELLLILLAILCSKSFLADLTALLALLACFFVIQFSCVRWGIIHDNINIFLSTFFHNLFFYEFALVLFLLTIMVCHLYV